jgi:hypothetical protein
MGTTAKFALPYPELSDPADAHASIKPLADAVDAALGTVDAPLAGIQAGECEVWDGTQWVRSTVTRVGPSSLGGGARDGTKFLRDDGQWVTVQTTPGVGSITSAMILDGTIVGADMAVGAVTTREILDGTITAADLAPDARSQHVAASVAALNAQFTSTPPNGTPGTILTPSGVVVPLTYITSLGRWQSAEIPLGGTTPGIGTGGSFAIATQGVGYGAGFSAISWTPAACGLTLQLKWAGGLNGSGNHILAHGGIFLEWAYSGGATTGSMSDRTAWQDPAGVYTYVWADFANVGNPGGYDMIAVACYGGTDSGGSMGLQYGAVVGRWIG